MAILMVLSLIPANPVHVRAEEASAVPTGTLGTVYVQAANSNGNNTDRNRLYGEITGLANAKESLVIKVYSGDTLLATTTLAKTEYLSNTTLGANIVISGSTSSSWNTVWEAGMPRADLVPDKAVLYIDDEVMNTANVTLNGIDNLGEPTVWANLPGVNPAPAAPVYVVEVNGVQHETLEAAFAAATKGETIKLLADATFSGQNAADKLSGYVIDLNEKTMTLSGNTYLTGETTIKNGNIVVSGYVSDSYLCLYTADTKLTLDDVKLTGTMDCYAVLNGAAGSTLIIKNSTIDVDGNVTNPDTMGNIIYGGNVTVDNSTIKGSNTVRGIGFSNITIQNGSNVEISGVETGLNCATVTVDNSTVTITNATKRAVRLNNNALTLKNGATLTATDCAEGIIGIGTTDTVSVSSDSTLNAVDKVTPAPVYVAEVNGTQYESVAAAMAAAKEAGITDLVITIIGENDASTEDTFNLAYGTAFESVTIKQDNGGKVYYLAGIYTGDRTVSGGQFVLDGVNITSTSNIWFECDVVLKNNSVLTRTDDSKNFVYYGQLIIEPGSKFVSQIDDVMAGSLVVDGGKTDGTYSAEPDYKSIYVDVRDGQTLTLKNGAYVLFNAANEIGRLILNGTAVVTDSKLEVFNNIDMGANSSLTVNKNSQVIANVITGNGVIIIDAAEMTAGSADVISADISGFTGTLEVVNNDGLEAKIVDGKIVLVEAPAIMVTYPVGNPVYPEGKVEYYNDMLEAVPYTTNCPRLEGATITLLKDTSGAGLRFMENGMVFDLNGHTYTITAGTGSQGTNTSGFQIRPEVTTNVLFKNGTIKVAEGAPVVWMFNCYATDFIVENVTIDCTNMAWSYGKSCYVAVSRSGDNVQFVGNTKVENFNSEVAGAAINVGGTMTIGENVVPGGSIELDAGATLTAPAGLDVVTADGYKVVYENGTYVSKSTTIEVSTKDELDAALSAAQEGETILLTTDIDYGVNLLTIDKPIILDLGGNTLTTRWAYGGMWVKNNATIKNGTIVHASNTSAIRVWNAAAFEDLVIDVQGKGDANKTIGGIVLQSGSTTRVGSIKNVTIQGDALTNGIETYNCGDAAENVIGSMENVTIDAKGTGMLISAPCGTATNCSISGDVKGIELWIKGTYSASLTLEDCDVVGRVDVHDEYANNVTNNGTLTLTTDAATTGVTTETVTLTINHAEESQVKGEVLKGIIENAEAQVNGTYYATFADAMAAAKAGDTVTVFAGTYAVPAMKAGITVVGEVNADGTPAVLLEGTLSGTLENLTLKNLHIKGGNAQRWAYGKGDLVFENVTFEATSVYALHFDGITAGATLLYKDCTIIGWAAMSGSPASCVFDGCTVKDNGAYGVIRTYFPATIENCTFDVDGANPNDVYQDGIHAVDATINVNNSINTNGDIEAILNISGASKIYVNDVLVLAPVVATIGEEEYFTLQDAINVGGNITLQADVTEEIQIPENATINLDLNGKTLTGCFKPFMGELTVKNGSIVNTNASYSAIEINAGELVLENVNVSSARHGVRIDGAVIATINGGEYKSISTSGTRHAVNVSGAANVTIKAGIFVGPKGTAMDSGSAVCVQAGATVTIEGGNFSGGKNNTLSNDGTLTVKGGTFDQDPSAYVPEGYISEKQEDGTYKVRELKDLIIVVSPVATMSTTTITVATMDEAVAYAQANPADSVTYRITGPVELTTGYSHGILDLGKNVTIEGVTPDAKLTIVGGGVPDIQGVTFKNITIADEGAYLPTANEFMYQNFIDCSFENVTFEDGIRVSGTTTITDCTVNANTTNEYAIWMDEGNFTMTGTTVTAGNDAYGLLKSDAVDTITITGNTFEYLGTANKEALNVKNAKITASNNKFIDCTEGVLPADKTNYAADGTTVITDAELTADNTVVNNVAKIGNTKYATLADAIAAANGGEVEILCDVTESLSEIKNVTLTTKVAGGVTVTNTDAENWISMANVTIGSGVTLDMDNAYYTDAGVNTIEGTLNVGTLYNANDSKTTVQNGGKIITTGMIVNRYHYNTDSGIYVYGDGEDSTVEVSCADTIGTYSGTFYAKDAVIEGNMLWIDYKKNSTEEADKYSQSTPTFENSVVRITKELRLYKDATLTLTDSAVTAGTVQVRENATPVVTMTNSTIKAASVLNLAGASLDAVLGEDGTVTFQKPVAKIGDTKYYSLAEALTASQPGDEIVLLAPVVIAAGETLTLDKVVTITYTSNVPGEDMITNKGNLVIDGATLVYTNTDATASNVTVSTINCEPGSTLEVKSGVVKNDSANNAATGIYAYAIDLVTNGNLGEVTATISGGEVISTNYMGIRQFVNSTTCKNILNVTGGTIKGATRGINVQLRNNMAYTTITGGTVEGGDYSLCFLDTSENLSVTGGNFSGSVWYSGTAGFISGGTFDEPVNEAYCAEGYVPVANEDGTYGVVEATEIYASQNTVTGEYYETVSEALAAAKSGETVKLITDVTEDTVLVMMKGITLDLNGFELTAEGLAAFNGNYVIDSSADTTGLLIVPQTNLTLPKDNTELPFWNESNGYYFITPVTGGDYQKFTEQAADGFKFIFKPSFRVGGMNGTDTRLQYIATTGLEDNGIKMALRVTWTGSQGQTAKQDFVYTEELIKSVYSGTGSLLITMSNLPVDQVKVMVVLESSTGVEFVGAVSEYNAPTA